MSNIDKADVNVINDSVRNLTDLLKELKKELNVLDKKDKN